MQPPAKLRVGVIGVGKMGGYHLKKYLSLEDATVVGFFDPSPERAKQIEADTGVPAFATLTELLFEVDAVTVASPTDTHAPIAKAALENGVHVLVEKPLAASVAEGEAMVALAREKGLVLQVGMVERFRLAELAKGMPSEPALFIETHRLSPQVGREASLDVVSDLMIHDLDLALSLVDEDPQVVSAIGMKVVTSELDIANVRLEFPRGTVINLNVSRVSAEPVRKLRLFTKRAYVSFDFCDNTASIFHRSEAGAVERLTKEAQGADPLLEQNRDFLVCIRTGRRPLVNGSDGVRALKYARIVLDRIRERSESLNGGAPAQQPEATP